MKYEGQNAMEYFMGVKMTLNLGLAGKYNLAVYSLSSKEAEVIIADPDSDAKKIGTGERSTIDGKKKLDKWEFTQDLVGEPTKAYAYIDPSSGVPYAIEITMGAGKDSYTMVMELKRKEIKLQETYEESSAIGKVTRYSLASSPTLRAEIRCVADCLDGKYGVVYDFSSVFVDELELYFLCDSANGRITGAKHISGNVWECEALPNVTLRFTYDADSGTVTQFTFTNGGNSHIFNKI